MASYTYTALTKDNRKITGTTEASSDTQVKDLLTKQNLRVLNVTKNGGFSLKSLNEINIGSNKPKLDDIVIFTRQLATMINAGVPLVRSLATMLEQTEHPGFKKVIAEISKDVESGVSFADALEKHDDIFSPIYINMVKAGEAGGILDEILRKLAEQQEKDSAIRKKFKGAMTYPIVLITITTVVFIALMTIVVPKIGGIVADLTGGAELPPMTRIMLQISSFLTGFWYIHVGLLFGGSFFFRRWVKTKEGKRKFDKFLFKVPALNVILTKMAIARFARIFASLMTAGVSVIETIEITAHAIGNSVIEQELLAAAKDVANGKQLSEPLAKSEVFPPIVSQMLAIGEETGQSDTILLKVADFYEEEVDAAVEGMSSILEPIMIVVMGGMVGLVAASVLGPIGNLSNQL